MKFETISQSPALFVLALAAFAAIVAAAVMWLLPRMVKQGIDVSGLLDKASTTVSALNAVTDAVKALSPSLPGLSLIDKILEYSGKAVASAEQLYKTSMIPETLRKEEATNLVYKFLEAAGVEITEELRTVIDGAIEASVFGLPKTHGEVLTDSANSGGENC